LAINVLHYDRHDPKHGSQVAQAQVITIIRELLVGIDSYAASIMRQSSRARSSQLRSSSRSFGAHTQSIVLLSQGRQSEEGLTLIEYIVLISQENIG
jgi:hypothetical protein